MTKQDYKVGGEVDSQCGKCKAIRSHVIIAMVDGLPKKVECLSCHAVHNFRRPSLIKTRKRTIKSKSTVRVTAQSLSEQDAVNYSPKGKYENGMVLRHKSFGLGLITRAERRKITVVFTDDTRQLILIP